MDNKIESKKGLIIGAVIIGVIVIALIITGIVIASNNGLFVGELKGKYDLVQIEEDNRVTTKDDLDVLGKFDIKSSIEFNEDKTGIVDFMGETINFKVESDELKSENETFKYKFEGNKLVVYRNNTKYSFEKHSN